jgi:hypothetical protein
MMAALPTLCTALITSPVRQGDSPELRKGCAGRQNYTGRLGGLGVKAGERRYNLVTSSVWDLLMRADRHTSM